MARRSSSSEMALPCQARRKQDAVSGTGRDQAGAFSVVMVMFNRVAHGAVFYHAIRDSFFLRLRRAARRSYVDRGKVCSITAINK